MIKDDNRLTWHDLDIVNNSVGESIFSIVARSNDVTSINFPSQPQRLNLKHFQLFVYQVLHPT